MTNKNNGNSSETYAYIKLLSKYYWIEKRAFFSPSEAGNNLMMGSKDLNEERAGGDIKSYDDICYRKGGSPGCLNLLNQNQILKPSDTPILDENIKMLIENVSGYKQENIDYLHKAILYKYLNINDFTIPAITFFGKGGSGKGTFISLLGTIFGEDNVMANLGQRELVGDFDTFKGQHIIVEFAEVTTNNTQGDKKILNKLKNLVGSEYIMVNEKGVKAYRTNSIAWFFISSNSNKPLQLDDKDKGNRRFSIIQSDSKLENGKQINNSVRDNKKVSNYLAWLHKEYPKVLEYKKLEALDNQDKKDLEERSQEEANAFWDWVYDNFPSFRGKKTMADINTLIEMFCNENFISQREFQKFLWMNSRYPKKKIRIGDKTYYGVELPQNTEQ